MNTKIIIYTSLIYSVFSKDIVKSNLIQENNSVEIQRNPCKNIIDNYQIIYEENMKMKGSCWENIYNTLNDNSNYKYDNICVYAFEKHICNMIVYNIENYENLQKNWCINEYKNAVNTYKEKCSRGYFGQIK